MHIAHGYGAHSSSTPFVSHTFSRRDLTPTTFASTSSSAASATPTSTPSTVTVTALSTLTPIQRIQSAFDRVTASDIKYRFVIDMSSLRQQPA
jgi:hypothetical protein